MANSTSSIARRFGANDQPSEPARPHTPQTVGRQDKNTARFTLRRGAKLASNVLEFVSRASEAAPEALLAPN